MISRSSNAPPSGFPAAPDAPGKNFDDRPAVLLVDDQPIVIAAVRRQLATEGDIEFHACTAAAAALETAARLAPSVILQDLVMPDGDGLEK